MHGGRRRRQRVGSVCPLVVRTSTLTLSSLRSFPAQKATLTVKCGTPSPSTPGPLSPYPPLLPQEFSCTEGDADGNTWDPFALELINASDEADIKRRDLYDGAPLLATWDVRRWCASPPYAHASQAHAGPT
jgi:hypothetical protein